MGTKESDWLNDTSVQAVIEVIARRVTAVVIAEHIKSCPHGQKLDIRWAWLAGLCTGCGLVGGVAGGLVKVLIGMLT